MEVDNQNSVDHEETSKSEMDIQAVVPAEELNEVMDDVKPSNGDTVVEVKEDDVGHSHSNNEIHEDEPKINGISEEVDSCQKTVCEVLNNCLEEKLNKSEESFLDNITVGVAESPAKVNDDESDDPENKYTEEDSVRRVLIKNIDKKKTADDVEDYFFDNYPECGIEHILSCKKMKKWFNGVAIITFEKEQQAKQFLEMDFRKPEEIGFRNKLYKISLVDNKKKREERLKKFNEQNKNTNLNGEEFVSPGCTVSCIGFSGNVKDASEIQCYMKENHENVVDVKLEDEKAHISFGDQRSAQRFLGLAYVKYKGAYIYRKYNDEIRRAEKRKREGSSDQLGNINKVVGCSFKLTGFQNPNTNYHVIKQKLEEAGVDQSDVKFIRFYKLQKEAVVWLNSNKVGKVVVMLNNSGFTVEGDRITAQEGDGGLRKPRFESKRPREIATDWSDY